MSFIQPCLLVMLHNEPAHGYSLLDGLEAFGFKPGQLDPSLVYRSLRDMEETKWVISEWGEDSLGPQRRMYRITSEGEAFLKVWITDLRKTREEIDALLTAYEQVGQDVKGGDET